MTEEVDEQSMSALRENISKKGKNSYYYAHGHKNDGPAWDGKEEPRLISSVGTATESVPKKKIFVSNIDEFSWLDGTKNVKVYIEYENASEVADDCITLNTTESSVEFRLAIDNDKEKRLCLDPLNNSIESATYKKKTGKFMIVLQKKTEGAWYQLKKSS